MGKSVKEGVMPKEYIENRYHGQHALDHRHCPEVDSPQGCPGDGSCKGEPVALDDSAIKVGWAKGLGAVEIAVVRDRDGSRDSDPDAWHSQMDRAGLNRLIRTLRRARDDAFGKDE